MSRPAVRLGSTLNRQIQLYNKTCLQLVNRSLTQELRGTLILPPTIRRYAYHPKTNQWVTADQIPLQTRIRWRIRNTFSYLIHGILGLFAGSALYTYLDTENPAQRLFRSENDEHCIHCINIHEEINENLYVKSLRDRHDLVESRPQLQIASFVRVRNYMAGILSGHDRLVVPPIVFQDVRGMGKEYISIQYLGKELCGHPGIVHGGMIATLLDEGMARCSFNVLPTKAGVTAHLEINYKAPCREEQITVLRCRVVEVSGRKAKVVGSLETLPDGEGNSVVLASGSAVMVTPKTILGPNLTRLFLT